MLEVPDAAAQVAVVRDADQVAEFQLVHAGLFLHFAQGRDGDVLAFLAVPLGQVPEAAALDQEIVAAAVGHQSAGRVDLTELGADAAVHPGGVVRGDVDAREGLRGFEHVHEGVDVDALPEVEFHGVGVGERLFVGTADDDAAFLEIYLVHRKIAIFAFGTTNVSIISDYDSTL